MSEPTIATAMHQVAAMVGTARRLLADGKTVDLAALEDMIRGLCQAVLALPAERGRAMRPRLEALSEGLERLDEDLRRGRDAARQG